MSKARSASAEPGLDTRALRRVTTTSAPSARSAISWGRAIPTLANFVLARPRKVVCDHKCRNDLISAQIGVVCDHKRPNVTSANLVLTRPRIALRASESRR
jgi:hypothetical protein